MRNINRVCISGNMTREPELRRTQSGMSILTIGVAVNDSKKNPQTGQWEDYANYIDCTMFGNRAESITQYLHKGTKVFIEGKLRWSSWQDKDTGKNRSKIEVLIDEIEFDNQNRGQQGYQQTQYAPPQQYQQPQMQNGYYAPPAAQPAPQQPQPQQYAQPAPQQYQQPQAAPQAAPQPAQQAQPAQQQISYDTSVYDDDIPF